MTIASRVLPPRVLFTPGSWVTKSNAPRPTSGRLVICLTLIVAQTDVDCVWIDWRRRLDDDRLLQLPEFQHGLDRRRRRAA